MVNLSSYNKAIPHPSKYPLPSPSFPSNKAMCPAASSHSQSEKIITPFFPRKSFAACPFIGALLYVS